MNLIIDNLYIGSYANASDPTIINTNITHIVNASHLNNCFPDSFNYLRIDIDDDEEEDISRYFSKTSRFIHNAILKKGTVFVHCVAGKSRSATLVIAYLCQKKKMKLCDAINLLESKRVIDINQGFHEQLKKRFKEKI